MSERQARGSMGRMSSSGARALRRVRVMSAGRWHAPVDGPRAPAIIAVSAAEAGIGKSVVACNLAASFASLGRRVVLVDLDFRAPRQHTLLGAAPPDDGLEAWLERKRVRRDEPARSTPVRNLRLLPCTAVPGGAPSLPVRQAVMTELHDLDSEVVVVDLGPDNRDDIFDFFAENAFRLLVTSSGPAALQATYAFLKGAALRAQRKWGDEARDVLAHFSGGLVGNGAAAPEDEETFHAFSRLVREHLGIPLPVVGCLTTSERIAQSVVARQPLTARRGIDDNVRQFHHMAEAILNGDGQDGGIGVGAGRDCPLDGDPIAVAIGPLPAPVESYKRKHLRYPVDWAATLQLPSGDTPARVRDVSESGAAVETAVKLALGDTAVLHFHQLSGQPAVEVVVKNVLPTSNRIGLGFLERGRIPPRLVAAARTALARSSS